MLLLQQRLKRIPIKIIQQIKEHLSALIKMVLNIKISIHCKKDNWNTKQNVMADCYARKAFFAKTLAPMKPKEINLLEKFQKVKFDPDSEEIYWRNPDTNCIWIISEALSMEYCKKSFT